jgi:hypothetical protein
MKHCKDCVYSIKFKKTKHFCREKQYFVSAQAENCKDYKLPLLKQLWKFLLKQLWKFITKTVLAN